MMNSISIARETGNQKNPTLIFAPALGTSPTVWEGVIEHLSINYHCVSIALPGHRESVPGSVAPESIAELAQDLADLAKENQWSEFLVAGVSIGGALAIEFAMLKPDGLKGIAICCAAGRFGTEQSWIERANQVKDSGTGSLIDFAARRWFAPGFSEKDPEPVGVIMNDLLNTEDSSYVSLCMALSKWDRRDDVSEISTPSIVVSGELDPASTPAEGSAISEKMSMSRFVTIPGTSHLAPVEAPKTVAKLISDFHSGLKEASNESRLRGFKTRREVLGDEHVDNAQKKTTPETVLFQDFITKYAWGEVWSRDQLDRRSRSISTLSTLVAIGNEHELPMHIRAARKHGLTFEEIGEIFLQVGVYAGVPKANTAFSALSKAQDDENNSE